MFETYYAHTPARDAKDQSLAGWQLLSEHLQAVATLARAFASRARPVVASDSAESVGQKEAFHDSAMMAGLLHDLGKYRGEFQEMLRGLRRKGEQTRHKQAGAALAAERRRLDIAFAIAGHHGGLPDRADLHNMIHGPGGRDVASAVLGVAAGECRELDRPMPAWSEGSEAARFDLIVRVLFSCLVDADWTDTGEFHRRTKGQPAEPPARALTGGAWLQNVLGYIGERAAACRDGRIASIRREVLDASLGAAGQQPGLFAMAVPTGGGKTLAALAFALAHAQAHNLRRVIYVAPYLTIIEQNAREIRRALREEGATGAVFEHHSLAEPPGPDEDEGAADDATRRAENWDAPVVITTNVQFFESLFSNRPGQCRKLHNIARSVVILDECQTLPPDLVAPSCSMLTQLATVAGCSIVFCTATQPAWERRTELPQGLEGVRPIVQAELRLFDRLRRVGVAWPRKADEVMEWAQVAEEMGRQRAALCVVNTRRAAIALFNELRRQNVEGIFHLSTNMCPAHRLEVLDEVRRRLDPGERAPCRLVSTQLIECGCDVDFPLALREMAPLEGIVQAAGRCNREGLLNGPDGTPGGRVIVFRSPEGELPRDRWYRAGRDVVEQCFLALGREPGIDRPEDMLEYFRRLYQTGNLDAHEVQRLRTALPAGQFKTIWDGDPDRPGVGRYRVIEDESVPVVAVTWAARRAEIAALLDDLASRPSRSLFRQAGMFQVNLRMYELAASGSLVTDHVSGIRVWWGPYEQDLGLQTKEDPGPLIV